MNPTFAKFLQLSTQDRQDVFDATAEQRNTLSTYIEKDFWVCFVLDILCLKALNSGERRGCTL